MFSKQTIVVASQSQIKVNAVKEAFPKSIIIGVKAQSNIAEQPMNTETEQGAINRITHARLLYPGADLYIAIENGIYDINGEYRDKAVIIIQNQSGSNQTIGFSKEVTMPSEFVDKTRIRGFDKWTVAAVMHEAGIIKIKDDPHADFGSRVPRRELLKESIIHTYSDFKNTIINTPYCIKNIVFDFAGVLFECPFEEIIKKVFPQITDVDKIKTLSNLIFFSDIWSQYDKGLNITELENKICDSINSQSNLVICQAIDITNIIDQLKLMMTPIKDIIILIEQLHNMGMTLYGLTNMPKEIYDYLIGTYDFLKLFSGIVSSAYTGLIKPEIPIYEHLLTQHKINAEETIFIDDRSINLNPAKMLGINTILFTNTENVRNELKKFGLNSQNVTQPIYSISTDINKNILIQ